MLVPSATGCKHWAGADYKAGKPGRVRGRSPGAAPEPVTPSDHANALASRLVEVLSAPPLTARQGIG